MQALGAVGKAKGCEQIEGDGGQNGQYDACCAQRKTDAADDDQKEAFHLVHGRILSGL